MLSSCVKLHETQKTLMGCIQRLLKMKAIFNSTYSGNLLTQRHYPLMNNGSKYNHSVVLKLPGD